MLPMSSRCKEQAATAVLRCDPESSVSYYQINKDRDKNRYIDLILQARQGEMQLGTDGIWYISKSCPDLGYTIIIWYDYKHDKGTLYVRAEKDPTSEELESSES